MLLAAAKPRIVTRAEQDNCPIRAVLDQVGDRWTVLAAFLLFERPMRFNALRRSIEGISQRMLTLTLRKMEQNGMVLRSVEPTVPPQVEYSLTDLGRGLVGAIGGVIEWAEANREELSAKSNDNS